MTIESDITGYDAVDGRPRVMLDLSDEFDGLTSEEATNNSSANVLRKLTMWHGIS